MILLTDAERKIVIDYLDRASIPIYNQHGLFDDVINKWLLKQDKDGRKLLQKIQEL